MSADTSRYQITSLKPFESSLEINWQDGHVSNFPGIWLLDACQCKKCGSSETALRQVRLTQKQARPGIKSCTLNNGQLNIDWGEAHYSDYDLVWLRSNCLSATEREQRKFKPDLWGSEMQQDICYMSYPELADSPELHLKFLETILERGFVILREVPPESELTESIAALVGKLRMTNYEIYELRSKPNPEISADTAVPLRLHTDEPYRIDPPGITFFHVLTQSKNGGASTLADSFKIAESLRQNNPEAFDILCSLPAKFHRSLAEGRKFEYQHPVIQCDNDGDISSVRLLDRGMAPVDCALDRVEPFYDALRQLLELNYHGEGMIEIRLESGEMLVFNNQRLMHGRTSFNPADGRHVRTCSVDLDEFYSRLRVAYQDIDSPRQWMTFRKG